jgi:hypothetical protein
MRGASMKVGPLLNLQSSVAGRRRKRILRAIEGAAAGLLQELKTRNPDLLAQPGSAVFPKRIFITPEGSLPLPDGRSVSYLEIVQAKWDQFFAKSEAESELEFSEAGIRLLQQTVIDAHVLESRLMERIKEAT